MAERESKPSDVLGVRPAAEALKAAVETAQDFLLRICGPAADEFGLLLRDRVSHWRMINAMRLVDKARRKIDELPSDKSTAEAHPRLVMQTLEQGSWSDDDEVQDMWAGLLASSRSPDGRDDSNLIFISLLEHLTTVEAHFLNWLCETAEKMRSESGLISAKWVNLKVSELARILGIDDIQRLDRELDHLRALDLIEGGLPLEDGAVGDEVTVAASPTPLALHLYVRCQGVTVSPVAFFGLDSG